MFECLRVCGVVVLLFYGEDVYLVYCCVCCCVVCFWWFVVVCLGFLRAYRVGVVYYLGGEFGGVLLGFVRV